MASDIDNLKSAVGERIKQARSSLGMTQKELCEAINMPLPSLRNYELSKQIPGGEAINGLIRAGINANWLLTGEGPMLMTGQVQTVVLPAVPVAPKINVDALAAIIEGALRVAPNAAPAALAKHCAGIYMKCIEDGLITPDGIGEGNLNNAA